jgi:hypothetical protein
VDAASESVLASDGWGVSYPALRFRRYDLRTGKEAAAVRLGNQARCWCRIDGGDLIAATDTKLFRLDGSTLVETKRWDQRIPRFLDTIVETEGFIVGVNWKEPSLSIIDITRGSVRRRPVGDYAVVFAAEPAPLVLGRGDGRLMRVDATTGKLSQVSALPQVLSAALGESGDGLWAIVGRPAVESANSIAPGPPTTDLRFFALDGTGEERFDLPLGMRQVGYGNGRLWMTTGPVQQESPLLLQWVIGATTVESFEAPPGHVIVSVDCVSGVVLTLHAFEYRTNPGAKLSCFQAGE